MEQMDERFWKQIVMDWKELDYLFLGHYDRLSDEMIEKYFTNTAIITKLIKDFTNLDFPELMTLSLVLQRCVDWKGVESANENIQQDKINDETTAKNIMSICQAIQNMVKNGPICQRAMLGNKPKLIVETIKALLDALSFEQWINPASTKLGGLSIGVANLLFNLENKKTLAEAIRVNNQQEILTQASKLFELLADAKPSEMGF